MLEGNRMEGSMKDVNYYNVKIFYSGTLTFKDVKALTHKEAEDLALRMSESERGIDLTDHHVNSIEVYQINRRKA